MEAQRSQFAIKLLPSLTDFAFLLPIVFLFGRMDGVQTLLSDCDTGWHIRTGDWMVANRLIPTHDVFSFSKPNGVWFAWEWLSDLIFAGLNQSRRVAPGGAVEPAAAVRYLHAAFPADAAPCQRGRMQHSAHVVAVASSSVHWLARPHLFTLLFLVVFFFVLERAREGQTRIAGIPYFVLLPLATILWTNLHGGFIVGILMVGLYGVGEVLTVAFSADNATRRPAALRAAAWFGTALACLAASLVNPYTWRLHVHLFQYLRDPYASQHIAEFFSLSFHHPAAIFFEGLLLPAPPRFSGTARKAVSPSPCCCWCSATPACWPRAIFLSSRLSPRPWWPRRSRTGCQRLPDLEVAGWLRKRGARFNDIVAKTAATDALPRWHAGQRRGNRRWWPHCCSRPLRPSDSARNTIPNRIRPAPSKCCAAIRPPASSPTTSGATISSGACIPPAKSSWTAAATSTATILKTNTSMF